ncbi:hypothetical protein [Paenibacillus polymyxa]|uniref:hypothetical protein n=1 Tax=Paenibacillus polymyxa TaxID=1406 RepID=UPI00287FA252|nr:hypothetical protein [Paenibacillus polymyxa]
MRIGVLYAVVLVLDNGGQNMKSFEDEESAVSESNDLINAIKKSKRKGLKVYLSELEYDKDKNDRLVGSKFIDEYSELLFQS